MNRLIILLVFGVLASFTLVNGQTSSKLADQYYLDGEYEKAGDLYEQLYKKSNRSDFYFNKYIECLLALEQYERSKEVIHEQIEANPGSVSLYVTLGNVLERQGQFEEAEEVYIDAIRNLPAEINQINKLGSNFLQLTKYDLAIETFEKGQVLLKRPGLYANNLADLYRRKGDFENMAENYLFSLHANPKRLPSIQTTFQRYLPDSELPMLLEKIYHMAQQYPEADHFPEMLAWVFVQQRDFRSALRQVKALDTRMAENGHRVYRLARMAANAAEYDIAIEAFEYIVDSKGPSSAYYLEAKRRSLINQRRKITRGRDYTVEDLQKLRSEYNAFLDEIGRNHTTASIIIELAKLEAFYINDLDEAVRLLEEVVSYPGGNARVIANAKLTLGDFQLMRGEIWEATLLYSQVDKAFKEDLLGQDARFRNAKLSYYNGDFEWAQTQFDVLKASTSKLIANDALDLSVFIMDNLNLDTTAHPLTVYAEADLLVFQNRFDEALAKLQILGNLYPDHGLQDDIMYLKARLFERQREYDKAADMYAQIIEQYPEEIRADNAMFNLAELNELQLGDLQKAQELYERIFIEYSGSTFSVEARKRYRQLRGDFTDPVN